LANSFLVIACEDEQREIPLDRSIFVFSGCRRKCFTKVTLLNPGTDLPVRRLPLYEGVESHSSHFKQTLEMEPLYNGKLLIEDFFDVLNCQGWIEADLVRCMQPWLEYLRKFLPASEDGICGEALLPGEFMDCIPINLIRDSDGVLQRIDQEWVANDPITVSYVLFRGLHNVFSQMRSVAGHGPLSSSRVLDLIRNTMEMAGIKCRSSFSSAVQREILFQNAVSGMESWNENDLERASLPGLRMTDTLKTLRESESELAQAKQCLEQAYKALEFQFTNQEQDLQRVQSQFAALKSELESVAG